MPSSRPLVLLVEDEPAHRELIERAFSELHPDYRLRVAGSLREAHASIRDESPNLVISDLMLPDGLGTELIGAEPGLGSYPVVVLTSHGDEQTAVNALHSGALDYLVKSETTLSHLPLLAERALAKWENFIERRRAEEALRDSETRFRFLAEHAADIIFRVELLPHRRFVYVSPAATALLGYTPQEHYAEPGILHRIVHPDDRSLLAADPTTEPVTTTMRCFAKDGRLVWLESRMAPVLDGSGKLVAVEGVARDVTRRKQVEEALRERERDLQELTAQLAVAEDQERRRLAMDIHDSLGQRLTLLKLNLERTRTSWQADDSLAAVLEDCLRLLGESIKQTRSLTFDLYPAMLDDLGLVPTLHWFGREFEGRTGIRFQVRESGESGPLPSPLAGYLFRAFKELLNNAAKHSGAREVVLEIRWQPDRLSLALSDDGRGFPGPGKRADTDRPGLGLRSIRERLMFLGSSFHIESAPGKGSRVSLEVALGPAAGAPSR